MDLLQFYAATLKIIHSNFYAFALINNEINQELRTIITNFVSHIDLLRSTIGNATLELVTEIQKLLQDNKSTLLQIGFTRRKATKMMAE